MAMMMYPEVQKRAHDELDSVVGQGRIPTFEDCEKMPYMQAMVCHLSLILWPKPRLKCVQWQVKEVIRWRPVAPLGLPHETYEVSTANTCTALAWQNVANLNWKQSGRLA